jgi:hypothetical protein
MVVPEGSVGGLRWACGAAGCRGGGPESLAVLWSSILCRVGEKVALAAVLLEVWLLHLAGASYACSSHSSHVVFSPTRVGG